MPIRDRLLAALVALIWGCNFLAIHATLGQFPPVFSAALRFVVLAVPTILFVPWPKVKVRYLLGYGLGFGTAQFAFLYIAMANGMPTGLVLAPGAKDGYEHGIAPARDVAGGPVSGACGGRRWSTEGGR